MKSKVSKDASVDEEALSKRWQQLESYVKAKKSKKIKVLAKGYARKIKRNQYKAEDNKDQIEEENSEDERTQEIDLDDLSDTDKRILEQLEIKMSELDEDEGDDKKPEEDNDAEGKPKENDEDSKQKGSKAET